MTHGLAAVLNLTFHGIGLPGRNLDSGEERVWLSQSAFEEILDAAACVPDLRITFDDGNRSDVDIALPALAERGLQAAFFVVAARIGRPEFLSAQHLRDLVDAGMEIGSHGMQHRRWRGLSNSDLIPEIADAKDRIEQLIGRPVVEASCPFGEYDRRALAALRRCGFKTVYTSDRGWADEADWLQPRNTLHTDDNASTFRRLLDKPSPLRQLFRHCKLVAKRCR